MRWRVVSVTLRLLDVMELENLRLGPVDRHAVEHPLELNCGWKVMVVRVVNRGGSDGDKGGEGGGEGGEDNSSNYNSSGGGKIRR